MHTVVKAKLYNAGRFRVPERWVVPGGSRDLVEVPDLLVLIDHPEQGLGLFDTGSSAVFGRNTGRFTLGAYRRVTQLRMTATESAWAQLHADGVETSDIR